MYKIIAYKTVVSSHLLGSFGFDKLHFDLCLLVVVGGGQQVAREVVGLHRQTDKSAKTNSSL